MFANFGSTSPGQRRESIGGDDMDGEDITTNNRSASPNPSQTYLSDIRRHHPASMRSNSTVRPKPLSTPSKSRPVLHNLLPSAPTSPPTPAPSPTPHQRIPSWQNAAGEDDDSALRDARIHFSTLSRAERQRFLVEIFNLCDKQLLSFVHHFVSPRLRKDPFKTLPNELCLRVSF